MKKNLLIIAVLSFAFLSSKAPKMDSYHVSKTFPINNGGDYDYITVDSASKRLYVAHGDRVNVVDKVTGDSIGVINTEKDVHGIALVKDLGKGYITNGSGNDVIVFDLESFKVITTVPAGEFADGILYDDFSKKVVTCNGEGKSMTVIDPSTDKVVATIHLSDWPEAAASDGRGKLYVNNAGKSEVDVIDTKTYKVIHKWPIAPGKNASGLAIDRVSMRLFAGCDNKWLVVMDATNGKVVTTLPIGEECDAVSFDKKLHTIYSSNGDGTLTIIKEISADKFSIIQNLKTKQGARTNAVDQGTHDIYLTTGEFAPKQPGDYRAKLKPGTFHVLVVSLQ